MSEYMEHMTRSSELGEYLSFNRTAIVNKDKGEKGDQNSKAILASSACILQTFIEDGVSIG